MRNNMSQNIFFFFAHFDDLFSCASLASSQAGTRGLCCVFCWVVYSRYPKGFQKCSNPEKFVRQRCVSFGHLSIWLLRERVGESEEGGCRALSQHALNHKSITSSESHQIDFHRRWLLFSYDDNNSHHPTLLMSLALFWLDSPSMWRKLHSVCL